jgi:hypothetical protein
LADFFAHSNSKKERVIEGMGELLEEYKQENHGAKRKTLQRFEEHLQLARQMKFLPE